MKTAPVVFLLASAAASAQSGHSRLFRGRRHRRSVNARRKPLRSPNPNGCATYMERMSAEPHIAGSPASKAVAEYTAGLFREWGLEVQVEEFEALLPYPKSRALEMTAPTRFTAKLAEPKIPQDRDSGDKGQVATYNAYSGNGDVTGQVVYVNYGIPEDYEQLKKLGIDVKGKIALARYGKSWRGTKAKVAQENGAVGCLIYSDPARRRLFPGRYLSEGRIPST